ncbi:MAG: ComF family protein [Pseudomonadota bacterium]
MVYQWKDRLLSLLFPPHCRLCGVTVPTTLPLCGGCHADLPWPGDSCMQCGANLSGPMQTGRCGRCQLRPPAFDNTTALLRYRPPADYLVQRLKFAGELALAPLLAGLLAEKIVASTATLPEQIIPVPLHRSRLRERGFNQATEIARLLGRELQLPVNRRLCKRSRKTDTQSLLPMKIRHWNVRNAFTVTGEITARHVAIVDDVMTTGHTVNEMARVLRDAGAEHIDVWVVARAGR